MAKFKVGDKVRVVKPKRIRLDKEYEDDSGHSNFWIKEMNETVGKIFTIDSPPSEDHGYSIWFDKIGECFCYIEDWLELVEPAWVEPENSLFPSFDSSPKGRKAGKIKMELVETGFPNALLKIGEMMTWAGDNKGYNPNDWKTIPDAHDAYLGAASRHRLKRLAGQDLDDESNFPHLCHEAFNVLAQLELLLTGELK